MSDPSEHQAQFRFYAELNDFLPRRRRQQDFVHRFNGAPSVKDTIEAIGIPHTEVDLILVDGKSVGFDHPMRAGERVAVYPVFEGLDISPLNRLRETPLRDPRFVLDVHLGKLARRLRMLGFDAAYGNDADDPELAAISVREGRILLTRDLGLLKRGAVTHGYWVRSTQPERQVGEVLNRFDLFSRIAPFTRCTACNGPVVPVEKREVWERLPERTKRHHDAFHICRDCRRIYWKGSHYRGLTAMVESLVEKLVEKAEASSVEGE